MKENRTITFIDYKLGLKRLSDLFKFLVLTIFVGQLIIETAFDNTISNVLCVINVLITTSVVFNSKNCTLDKAFVATLVFVINISNSLFPMLGTLLEGHPLIFSLINPIETFFHRLLYSFVLIVALFLSNIKFLRFYRLFFYKLGKICKVNMFLSIDDLWKLGYMGIVLTVIKEFHLSSFLDKIIDGLSFILWTPFLILIPPYFNLANKKIYLKIFIYYIVMIGLSLLTNSRMGMIGPLATIGVAGIITYLMGFYTITRKGLVHLFQIGLFSFFILGQLSDLSTAILVERGNRTSRDGITQLEATFERFLDKESLSVYKNSVELRVSGVSARQEWVENYIRNPFIARLVQIKYDDNCFHRISEFSKNSFNTLSSATQDKIWSNIPDPILTALDINIKKEKVNSYSIGDMMDFATGRGFLGGFRTGSVAAHAYALFDWVYPFVLLLIYTLIFSAVKGLFMIRQSSSQITLSSLALLYCFNMYTDISLESIIQPISFLVRGIFQLPLMYFIALKILAIFNKKSI